jgi:DNA-binding transcriptional LysR family regulator
VVRSAKAVWPLSSESSNSLFALLRAARSCHVAQPGLSAQIRQLEELLDARLFERDRRNVRITAAGEEIVRCARGARRSARNGARSRTNSSIGWASA